MTEAELETLEAKADAAVIALGMWWEVCADSPALGEFVADGLPQVPKLLAELRKARAVLADVEWGCFWIDDRDQNYRQCPSCYEEGQHAPDCALAAALGKA